MVNKFSSTRRKIITFAAMEQPIKNKPIIEECNFLSIDGQPYLASPVNDIVILDMENNESEVFSGKQLPLKCR